MTKFQIKAIVAVVAATFISACSSIPLETPKLPPKSESINKLTKTWDEPSVVREGKPMVVLLTPLKPPKQIRDKKISVELEHGTTIKDIISVLAELDYSIILQDSEVGDKSFWIPKYTGTVGGLLDMIQKSTDTFFLWDNGTILVTGKEKVALGVPQDKIVVEKISAGLKELGADGISSSYEAGFVSFDVKPSQLKQVKRFMERITNNAALVTMHVGIVTVDLSRDLKRGVDWTSLNVLLGKNADSMLAKDLSSTTTSAVPALASAVTRAATTTATDSFVQLAGTSMKGSLFSKSLSLSGLINALDKYGETDTLQDVLLKTVTGQTVELKSVTQIPYVSGVGVTTTPTAVTSNVSTTGAVSQTAASQASNLLGSAKTSTANDGITFKITPLYDAQADTVTLEMNLAIQSVLSFNTLAAGNQIGSLSQPTTGDRSFNDIIRVRPGQTVLVGGIIYNAVTDDRIGIAGFTQTGGASNNVAVKRQEMIILIKPTITAFGSLEEHESEEMFPHAVQIEKAKPKKTIKQQDTK